MEEEEEEAIFIIFKISNFEFQSWLIYVEYFFNQWNYYAF